MTFVLVVAVTFALAALRRFSVVQTVTFIHIILYNVCEVSLYPSALHQSPNIESWLQPCGTPVATVLKKYPQRHSIYRTLKRVRTQLRVANNHFNKDLWDMYQIYTQKLPKMLHEQYETNWLPKNESVWRNVSGNKCMEKSKKAEILLPNLYDTFQRFAITFQYLQHFHLETNIYSDSVMKRRNEIIDGMHNEVIRVLCEVETAILNLGFDLPIMNVTIIENIKKLTTKKGGMTQMLVQDCGVLRIYHTFLKEWMTAFRNATTPGNNICKPSEENSLNLPKSNNNNNNNNNKKKKKKNKRKQAVRKTKKWRARKMKKRLGFRQPSSSSWLAQNSSLPMQSKRS